MYLINRTTSNCAVQPTTSGNNTGSNEEVEDDGNASNNGNSNGHQPQPQLNFETEDIGQGDVKTEREIGDTPKPPARFSIKKKKLKNCKQKW